MHLSRFFLFFILLVCISSAFAQEEVGVVVAEPVFARITVDGDVRDWAGIKPAYVDTIGDNSGSQFDFAAAYIANDDKFLYIRISFAEDAPFGDLAYLVNLAFNTDLDRGTGFGFAGVTGSEFFIQSGNVYDQRSGQNFVDVFEQTPENNWGAFASADAAPFGTTKEVEIGLRRDLTFSDDEQGMPGLLNPDGAPIFEFPELGILFEAEDENYDSVELMPNADPLGGEAWIEYTFAEGPALVGDWSFY
jgi:hypothetical protein